MRDEHRCRSWPVRRGVLAAALLGAAGLVAASAEDAERPVASSTFLETVEVRVVDTEVYVTDRKGRAVSGLTAADFVLLEDGKEVEISHFFAVEPGKRSALPAGAPEDALVPPAPPAHVVFYFDDFATDPQSRRLALGKLREILAGARQPGARYAIASHDGILHMHQGFTADRAKLLAVAEGMAKAGSLGVARQLDREMDLRGGLRRIEEIVQQVRAGQLDSESAVQQLRGLSQQVGAEAERRRLENRISFSALSTLVSSLAVLPGRKAVIYISEGLLFRPGEEMHHAIAEAMREVSAGGSGGLSSNSVDARSSALGALADSAPRRVRKIDKAGPTEELLGLTALANAGAVSFYAWKAQGQVGGVSAEVAGDVGRRYTAQLQNIREMSLAETLRVMAGETGGEAVVGAPLQRLVERAEGDFAGYYSLGFSPDHWGDGRRHSLEVKVRRRGARLRHRSDYIDRPRDVRLADRTTAALLLELDDNPLGLRIGIGAARPSPRDEDVWIVPAQIKVPLRGLALLPEGDVHTVDVELFIAARSPDGRVAPARVSRVRVEVPSSQVDRAGALYAARIELLLRAGPQRLAVGLVDTRAQTASFVGRDVDIGGDS